MRDAVLDYEDRGFAERVAHGIHGLVSNEVQAWRFLRRDRQRHLAHVSQPRAREHVDEHRVGEVAT